MNDYLSNVVLRELRVGRPRYETGISNSLDVGRKRGMCVVVGTATVRRKRKNGIKLSEFSNQSLRQTGVWRLCVRGDRSRNPQEGKELKLGY